MPRQLPPRPSLEQLKNQSKSLLKALQASDPGALDRLRTSHSRRRNIAPENIAGAHITLAEAQRLIAAEYGFKSWSELKAAVALRRADDPSIAETVQAIREAAGSGDLPRLTTLLDAHPELIDEPGGSGVRTALHQAVFGKSEAAVRLLLERGANPNIRCEGDNAYPLHFAMEKHLFPIIRLLVEHGADTVGEGDYHELGVLGWGTAWDYIQADPQIVAYLLAHGARHNIFSAVALGETAAIREIVARLPAELERRMDLTNRRRRPLHLAVIKRQPAALAALLDLGANPESLDEAGFTALDQAALRGEAAMAQMLLDRGAKLRLPAAVALNRPHDVERLLRRDPDALKPGGRWERLILRASEQSSGGVIEMLHRNGAQVNIHDDTKTAVDNTTGFTPLHAAAWHGNLSAIEVLLKHGADVRAREEKYHGTPAGWADYAGHKDARDLVLRGPIDIIKAIQYGLTERIGPILEENPDAVNRPLSEYRLFPLEFEGWHTPLVLAVLRGNTELVRLLLDRGADSSLRSPVGESLAEIAVRCGYSEIAKILDPNAKPPA
jgi:ankyrin repeat protein